MRALDQMPGVSGVRREAEAAGQAVVAAGKAFGADEAAGKRQGCWEGVRRGKRGIGSGTECLGCGTWDRGAR